MICLKLGKATGKITTLLAVSLLLQSCLTSQIGNAAFAQQASGAAKAQPLNKYSKISYQAGNDSQPLLIAQKIDPSSPTLFSPEQGSPAQSATSPESKIQGPEPKPVVNSESAGAKPDKEVGSTTDSSGKLVATGSNNPNDVGISAPPETTPPTPLAQTAQPINQPLLDPFRQYLPKDTGTVNLRRPFKLTVTGGIIHNLSFRDASVRAVLAELSRLGNVNILVDKSVSGTVTGELRDLTVSEAIDSVLAAAGFQSRTLDNNTVIVASAQSMIQLGLNRTLARAFHLSYANAYEVCQILNASVFNTGLKLETTVSRESTAAGATGGAEQSNSNVNSSYSNTNTLNINPNNGSMSGSSSIPPADNIAGAAAGQKGTETSGLTEDRRIVASARRKFDSATGFNDAGVNPEKIKIQGSINELRDFEVIQNNGGTLVIPDTKNNQVVIVGTPNDLLVAEEAIHLLDRRPRECHIQVSLIELTNQAIRSLGATVNAQGAGISAAVQGNTGAPLVNLLPGMGGVANSITSFISGPNAFTAPNPGVINPVSPGSAFTSPPTAFGGNAAGSYTITSQTPTPSTTPFGGIVGAVLPGVGPSIAGLTASALSQTAINFLALSQGAGGRLNVATLPAALNFQLNLSLQTNKSKLIANPSIVAEDNTEAFVEIADEIVKKIVPVITTSAGGTVVVPTPEITKVGIFLDILTHITDDGFVRLRLRPRVSIPISVLTFGVAPNQTQVTLESDREVITQEVRVKDGQTLVLAGLFREEEASQITKVPYLAETPVLGALFRNTTKGRDRTELMLLITPRIVEESPPGTYEPTPPRPL